MVIHESEVVTGGGGNYPTIKVSMFLLTMHKFNKTIAENWNKLLKKVFKAIVCCHM